jgi:FdhD protein
MSIESADAVVASNAVRWSAGNGVESERCMLANEVPLSLVYNGVPFAVMLVTPQDIENFVLGFSVTEGIIEKASEVGGIELEESSLGISAYVSIPVERSSALETRKKNLTGRTGCGLCGEELLENAVRPIDPVKNKKKFSNRSIQKAVSALGVLQVLNKETGTVHAAAWANSEGEILVVREDVGRHNALDKLIGVLLETEVDCLSGFALVTSRASYEMVQKAASVKISLLAAVSGPTDFAVRTAEKSGLTLIGFARDGRQTIYANAGSIVN